LLTATIGFAFALTLSPKKTGPDPDTQDPHLFATGTACFSCHGNLVSPAGEDISFGTDWRASMMANSARDPYWQAAVRREVMDHPTAAAQIEDECAACHMPMARFEAKAAGRLGKVFDHLPVGQGDSRAAQLAADGVSCTMCHQISADRFGEESSFTAGFSIASDADWGERPVYGPYDVDKGLRTLMHSASGFRQEESLHIQKSELCATCHTLITESLGSEGEVVGHLPEQVPYLEWRHSDYQATHSCQSCHMPVVSGATKISSVLGKERTKVSRHVFQGGNFFMLRMLNRYRHELGVTALPKELEASAVRTEQHLQSSTAQLSVVRAENDSSQLTVVLKIANLAGHKLPTGYPSRRSWIQFAIKDHSGTIVFESGHLTEEGRIVGNDNDDDPTQYESHYDQIVAPHQVQIYESVMVDTVDQVTTGLLSGVRFIKDNRLLPTGFDPQTADDAIAVHGMASTDANFSGGSDLVTYTVNVEGHAGPFEVHATLWYQPISYRWAQNLRTYDAPETNRFVGYYDAMAGRSGLGLTSTKITVPVP